MPLGSHASYGSDRAEPVYGQSSGARLVRILEVEREKGPVDPDCIVLGGGYAKVAKPLCRS